MQLVGGRWFWLYRADWEPGRATLRHLIDVIERESGSPAPASARKQSRVATPLALPRVTQASSCCVTRWGLGLLLVPGNWTRNATDAIAGRRRSEQISKNALDGPLPPERRSVNHAPRRASEDLSVGVRRPEAVGTATLHRWATVLHIVDLVLRVRPLDARL